MKNFLSLLVLLFGITFMSCEPEEVVIDEPDVPEATIIGRWQLVGFDNVIRYEFTSNKRYSIYSSDNGIFPTLEELLEENPDFPGHDWVYEGETVVVDLNFGNYSRLVPEFTCDNQVINWLDEDGAEHTTFYRESHDISTCQ